jgi:hypothetical protein
MRSASAAEWIVGRFTTKNRAASVVGDLVELQPQKELLWFWVSLIGVVVSVSWRAGIRLIAALFVYGVAFLVLAIVSCSPKDLQHWPPNLWFLWALSTSIGAVLWMTLTYAGIRYGLRDKVTQLALVWASLVTVAISFWREPMILFLCLAVSIGMASVSISKIRYRKATWVLLGTVVTGYAGNRLMGYLSMFGLRLLLHSGHKIHFLLLGVVVSFIVTWITVMACSHMHHWLLRDKPFDEKVEEGMA